MNFLKFFKKEKPTLSTLTEKQVTGNIGERAALEYLEGLGYILKEKNWRHSHSEIDLIMNDNGSIVFCEVRTQREESLHYKTQSESISENKKASLSRGAAYYMGKFDGVVPCRFDIVEITLEKNCVKNINHIKNAFYKTHSKTKGSRYKSCRH